MVVTLKGYVIVNQYGVISLNTFSATQAATWDKFRVDIRIKEERWVTHEELIASGFMCVPATITTDEFERKQ